MVYWKSLMSETASWFTLCVRTQKNRHHFYYPFVTRTWLWSCGTTPGNAHRLDCNKAHLVSVVWWHWSQVSCSVLLLAFLSLFLVIIFCLRVHVQPIWRHGVCNEKHSFSLSPTSFLSFLLSYPFTSFCLMNVMSLFVVFERHKCLCGVAVQL